MGDDQKMIVTMMRMRHDRDEDTNWIEAKARHVYTLYGYLKVAEPPNTISTICLCYLCKWSSHQMTNHFSVIFLAAASLPVKAYMPCSANAAS